MTTKNAKKIIAIGKYVLIAIFAIFFVIICVQSVKLNSLKKTQTELSNSLAQKQAEYSYYTEKEAYIEENFETYSEEELRKDNYIKEGEKLVTIKE